jgi:hypothetical protein
VVLTCWWDFTYPLRRLRVPRGVRVPQVEYHWPRQPQSSQSPPWKPQNLCLTLLPKWTFGPFVASNVIKDRGPCCKFAVTGWSRFLRLHSASAYCAVDLYPFGTVEWLTFGAKYQRRVYSSQALAFRVKGTSWHHVVIHSPNRLASSRCYYKSTSCIPQNTAM